MSEPLSEISTDDLKTESENLIDRIYNLGLGTEADTTRISELRLELMHRGISTSITTDITFDDTQLNQN